MIFALAVVVFLTLSQGQQDHNQQRAQCFSDVANQTINRLRWTNAAIIVDRDTDFIAQKLQEMELLVYEVNNNTLINSVFLEIYTRLFPDVQVIVFVDENLLKKIIHQVDGFDTASNHSTDWSYHSKWLVFTTDSSIVKTEGIRLHHLQNIAVSVLGFRQSVCSVAFFSFNYGIGGKQLQEVDELLPFPLRMFPNTRYRYNRRVLRVSTVETNSCAMIIRADNNGGIPYTGFCIDVLRIIAEHLNFTLVYVKAKYDTWGWINNGMMGQLKRREIDLVANLITVHPDRAQHIDYITPYLGTDEVTLFYKMPPAAEPIILLARPLQLSVYITQAAVMFAVIAVLAVIETFGTFNSSKPRNTVPNLSWAVFSSCVKQSHAFKPISQPGKLVWGCWWILVMLITSLYCGNLTATLADTSPFMTFDSIREVVDSDFSVGLKQGSAIEYQLQNSKNVDIKSLYEKMKRINETDPSVTSNTLEYHIQRVKQGKYMFLGYNQITSVILTNCNISKLSIYGIPAEQIAFAVQRHSPFWQDISKIMHDLNSKGILHKLWNEWNTPPQTGQCEEMKKTITLEQLMGGITVAGAGIGLALIVVMFEVLLAHALERN